MRAATTLPRIETYTVHEALTGLGRALPWKTAGRFATNVALFVAAPFVGLAYALAFPFIGLGMLAWVAIRAAKRRT